MSQTENLSIITMEIVKSEFVRACQNASSKDEELIFFILKTIVLQFNIKPRHSMLCDEHYVFFLQKFKQLSFEEATTYWCAKSPEDKSKVRDSLEELRSWLNSRPTKERIEARINVSNAEIVFIGSERSLSFNAKDIHPEKLRDFLDESKTRALKQERILESKQYKQACKALQISQARAQLETDHREKQKKSACEKSIEGAIGCGMHAVMECLSSFRSDEIENLYECIFSGSNFLRNLNRYIQSNHRQGTLNSKQLANAICECQCTGGSHV